jgi:hypothetical protein
VDCWQQGRNTIIGVNGWPADITPCCTVYKVTGAAPLEEGMRRQW